MYYTVDGLPAGANAAAFCPPPPPVVTDAADSSFGLVTSRVSMFSAEMAPPPASIGDKRGIMGDPGMETGVLRREHWVARPAVGFGELVPTRNNNMLPVPAITPNANQQAPTRQTRRGRLIGKGQVAWPRAFQRFPPVAGSGGRAGG